MKIEELTPETRDIALTLKVVEKIDQREVTTRDGQQHQVAEFLAADETGCIVFTLWDDKIESTEIGKSYAITGGYVNVFRNSMRLNVGRQGTYEASEEDVEANTENKLSDKHVENPRFRGGGFRRGGNRGGSRGGFGGGNRSGGFGGGNF